jgi:hypothetical protein
MSRGVSIQVEGLKEIKQKIGKLPENVENEFDAFFGVVASEFVEGAAMAANAHINTGRLAGDITQAHIAVMHWEMVSPEEYAAFVEFGTKSKVRIPAGLEAYAAQFKGSTGRKGAKEMIFKWCKSKGIPKEAWYPIFIKIMTYGSEAHPYFFPQLPIAQAKINQQGGDILKQAMNK